MVLGNGFGLECHKKEILSLNVRKKKEMFFSIPNFARAMEIYL
tara:strand:- start:61 stop:189 length:129 start_codon:yes stop_codon:yes gene_type:complete